MVRTLTDIERQQGFTSIVYVRRAGRTPAMGIEFVSGGSISLREFERRQRGQRKFRGELFVEVAPRPEVEASIRRSEAKKEEDYLARQEAKFEAARQAEAAAQATIPD